VAPKITVLPPGSGYKGRNFRPDYVQRDSYRPSSDRNRGRSRSSGRRQSANDDAYKSRHSERNREYIQRIEGSDLRSRSHGHTTTFQRPLPQTQVDPNRFYQAQILPQHVPQQITQQLQYNPICTHSLSCHNITLLNTWAQSTPSPNTHIRHNSQVLARIITTWYEHHGTRPALRPNITPASKLCTQLFLKYNTVYPPPNLI
jgi:hypothetical protein